MAKGWCARCWQRGDVRVYYLMRDLAPDRIAALNTFWGDSERALPIEGDLLRPDLGLAAKDVKKLKGHVDHFFHLAAIYDLDADAGGRDCAPTSRARAMRSFSPRRLVQSASIT